MGNLRRKQRMPTSEGMINCHKLLKFLNFLKDIPRYLWALTSGENVGMIFCSSKIFG